MTAVAKYVNALMESGIVHETGTQITEGGRRPALLEINNHYGYIVVLDFGQSFFRVAALNLSNQVLYKKIIPTSSLGLPESGINRMIDLIKETMQSVNIIGKPLAIGIAISGILKNSCGSRSTMPNLEGWNDIDLLTPISTAFNIPIFIDDAARMMALCESIIPSKGRYKNLIFVSIGTGIGTGIIVFGRLLRGTAGIAGELGHIIVNENGLVCGCGNRGCLEQYASVPAMVKNAKAGIQNGIRSSILDFAENNIEKIDSYSIAKAANELDKLAYSTLMEAGYYLGVGLSQLINLFNPQRIILGGGGVNISRLILEEAVKTCQIRALTDAVKNVRILKSDKGEDCALVGASIYTQDNLFGLYEIQENDLL